MFLLVWNDMQNERILEQTELAVLFGGDVLHGCSTLQGPYMLLHCSHGSPHSRPVSESREDPRDCPQYLPSMCLRIGSSSCRHVHVVSEFHLVTTNTSASMRSGGFVGRIATLFVVEDASQHASNGMVSFTIGVPVAGGNRRG